MAVTHTIHVASKNVLAGSMEKLNNTNTLGLIFFGERATSGYEFHTWFINEAQLTIAWVQQAAILNSSVNLCTVLLCLAGDVYIACTLKISQIS